MRLWVRGGLGYIGGADDVGAGWDPGQLAAPFAAPSRLPHLHLIAGGGVGDKIGFQISCMSILRQTAIRSGNPTPPPSTNVKQTNLTDRSVTSG